MTIVITMAGLGNRFRQAGYSVPKYQIKAKGKPLFDWSMISLSGYLDGTERFIFITRKEDKAEDFIQERCQVLNINDYKVIELDHLTDGQATTAMLAAPYWNRGDALLIYNIDTYVEPGVMNASQLKGDGFIPCFAGQGDHWSFVRLNSGGEAVEVREKVRISEHCTLGAYYFKTCGLYEQLYNKYYVEQTNDSSGEKYVAPLYNYLIAQGGKVYISEVDPARVHVLGTPEELQAFLGT